VIEAKAGQTRAYGSSTPPGEAHLLLIEKNAEGGWKAVVIFSSGWCANFFNAGTEGIWNDEWIAGNTWPVAP
jgi:hypothetical protein